MITIEQIQKLDKKVQAAVSRITALQNDNATLREKLDAYQKRISELEVMIERFKKDQTEIESGIIRALEQLDHLEDSMEGEEPAEEEAMTPSSVSVEKKVDSPDPPVVETAPSEEDASENPEESELDIF